MIDVFISQSSGNIGETSVLYILIGGLYLIFRKVINGNYTIILIITIYTIYSNGVFNGNGLEAIISGSVMLTAVFLINDKSTTPKSTLGQIIFGVLTAILAIIFNVYGYNPDGPFYAVIILNLFTPMINHFIKREPKDLTEVLN